MKHFEYKTHQNLRLKDLKLKSVLNTGLGNELDAKQNCHPDYYGEFSYSITDQEDSTSYCGTGDETWDVCTDYGRMTFDLGNCSTPVAYSSKFRLFYSRITL